MTSVLLLTVWVSTVFAQGNPPTQAGAAPGPVAAGAAAKLALVDTSGQGLAQLRDPFRRPIFVDPNARPRSELENFPVEQYKMVGVLTGTERLRAMLVGPNGKTYFVAENTKIGVHKGFIKKISPVGLVVREKVLNTLGTEESIDTELRLPSEMKPPADPTTVPTK